MKFKSLKLIKDDIILATRFIVGFILVIAGIIGLIIPIAPDWILIFFGLVIMDANGTIREGLVSILPVKYRIKAHKLLFYFNSKKLNKGKKVVVGMSGGIDSAVALILIKNKGFTPVGVSLKYDAWKDPECPDRQNACCTDESLKKAKAVCEKLGIEYKVIDIAKEFKEEVIDYFVDSLQQNETPSPCIKCNRFVKFAHLIKYANRIGADFITTGHYAKIEKNIITGLFELKKAKDLTKDQTYSLSNLNQDILSKTIFPLGNFYKKNIYRIAAREGLSEFFQRYKQSQDFCFVSGKSLPLFIKKTLGEKSGDIKTVDGKKIGTHKGLYYYTIGQRKNIRLPGGPYYVSYKDINENTLYVTNSSKDLLKKDFIVSSLNFISGKEIYEPIKVKVKTRSAQSEKPAKLTRLGKDRYIVVFDQAQRAITPGQIAVFYQGPTCIGQGTIKG